jgi:hypothetical protein
MLSVISSFLGLTDLAVGVGAGQVGAEEVDLR